MKNIELCGIGNGLVDLQYHVQDSFITELGLKKGEMRLVDYSEQSKLISMLGNKPNNICSGGSAANTIIGFTKFGGKAAYNTLLGDDDLGKFYADEFLELGIELSADKIKEKPTGTCLILITPDSERTMNTSLGATGEFKLNNLDKELIKRSDWIYIEGYKFSSPTSMEAVQEAVIIAKSNDVKIALTFSDAFITENFRNDLMDVVKKSSLIFCNEKEALSFTGASNYIMASEILKDLCSDHVITLGSQGSYIFYKNQKYNIPPYPADAIDSTGAGDMFAAGFMYGIISTGNPVLAGNLGSYSASRIVSQLGARLNESFDSIKTKIFGKN